MKRLFIFSLLLALAIPLVSLAAVFEAGRSYSLAKDQSLNENLYAAGSNVIISGNPKQDAWLAGSMLIIAGPIGRDIAAAGGNIALAGDVGQNARLVGGNVLVSSRIGGDLLALGGQIDVGGKIGGDAVMVGGSVVFAGDSQKNLTINGGTIQIQGNVAGSVKVKAGQKLVISKSAVIAGSLTYSAPQEATIEEGAKIGGEITFNQLKAPSSAKNYFGFFGLWWLAKLLLVLAAALAVWLVLKKPVEQAVKYAMSNFWKEVLRGFVLLVVVPAAAFILFLTLVGGLLAVAGLAIYLPFLVFGWIFTPILLGSFFFRQILKKPEFSADWRSIVVGAVLMWLLQLVPFVGWSFNFIFFLAALGMLYQFLYRHFKE